MALGTIRGELRCGVVRVGGAVVIRHVAGIAGGRCALIAVGVALQAVNTVVPPGQREPRGVVVVRGRRPRRFIMALRAVRGELRSRVVRINGAVVVGHVARIAIGRCALVPIGMAGNAIDPGMATGQGEVGVVMIER